MTNFLLAGLRNLGYKKSLSILEEESGETIPHLFDPKFKEFFMLRQFDSAIGYINLKENITKFNENQILTLNYELLKMKFFNALFNQDTVMALFLLRNDLKDFGDLFES